MVNLSDDVATSTTQNTSLGTQPTWSSIATIGSKPRVICNIENSETTSITQNNDSDKANNNPIRKLEREMNDIKEQIQTHIETINQVSAKQTDKK
jgi:hypothetical protein